MALLDGLNDSSRQVSNQLISLASREPDGMRGGRSQWGEVFPIN